MSTDGTKKLPTVTVVIPNHNYAQWLPQAIETVAFQDYPIKNLIVVDDGSTDNSVETVKGLLTDCKSVPLDAQNFEVWSGHHSGLPINLICSKDPKGPSYARNVAIRANWSSTHIFGFLDADDYWKQGKMSKSVMKFLEHPENVGVVYTDNDTLNRDTGLMIREYREPYGKQRLLQHNMVHSGSFVSRLAFEKVGLYDEEMRVAEDYDLWIRISEHMLISHIPESLVVAGVHSNNTTGAINMSIWQQNWQRIAQKMQARAKNGQKQ